MESIFDTPRGGSVCCGMERKRERGCDWSELELE